MTAINDQHEIYHGCGGGGGAAAALMVDPNKTTKTTTIRIQEFKRREAEASNDNKSII